MTVNAAYDLYSALDTADSLNALFTAITLYAHRLASMHLEPQDRQDAAQEAVLYVYRHLAKYDAKRGRFAPWVLAKVLASFGSYRRAKGAQKRGGGWQFVSLVPTDVDACYGA